MSQSDKFFQFPLCALARANNQGDTLDVIISYGLMKAGIKFLSKLDSDERKDECRSFGLPIRQADSYELAAHLGARICEVTLGSVGRCVARHDALEKFHRDWEKRNGPDPLVRIRKDICFDVRDDNTKLSFREFRVLTAIYSAVGAYDYRAVTARMIRVRAVGCKSEAVEISERNMLPGLPELLTEKELRGTITRLHETNWFARITPARHGRVTYYSNRLSEAELADKIVKKRTFKQKHAASRKQVTADVSARIKASLSST